MSRHGLAICAASSAFAALTGAIALRVDGEAFAHGKLAVVKIEGSVNRNAPAVVAAIAKYDSDPYRVTEWAGDHYPSYTSAYRMFNVCTPGVSDVQPWQGVTGLPPTFRYDASKDALTSITFKSEPFDYCDLMGTTTETLRAELSVGAGARERHEQVGDTIIYTDGLREILARYMRPKNAARYVDKTIVVQNVGNLCPDGRRSVAYVQVTLRRRFRGNVHETFQHLNLASDVGNGGYTYSTSWSTDAKDVCK